MKKLLLFAFAVLAFAACTQNDVEELSANRADVPETLTVGFEGGDDTRIQLNEAQKTVWTKDDIVSVFYRSNANQKWQYQGETGERVGNLLRVADATATETMHRTVVVYPYNENYYINPETYNIEATLPAVQHYAEDSYGIGDNLMVSQSEFTQFTLKNVCGWLKLQLTGNGERVQSITLRGNNEEQLAGLIYVDTATAESTLASEMGSADDNNASGNLVFDDAIVTELTLDCGEGVVLGAESKAFYIAVPPQTFEQGFTVEIECEDYELMTLTTEEELVIERNHIQPMASVEHNAAQIIPNNEIWYTNGSTTEATTPYKLYAFGVNITSNTYDVEKECWVITFDGDLTAIGEYAFAYCDSLTSITIPDSVTTIEYKAFYSCDNLTSVTIGDSVETIGRYAFYDCYSLTEFNGKFASEDGKCLIIDGTLNSFAIGCGATEYTIPDSVTTIGEQAFNSCYSLTSITIPDSVTTIGEAAFYDCDSLTSVTIGDSVTTIGDDAFSECYSLTSITIPDSVTTIGGGAFYYCDSLTSITIPDSVTTIGDYAFYKCYRLTSVTIGDSVTTIGNNAFYECYRLTGFNGKFASDDGKCLIVDGTLNSFAPAGLTSYTIPDSVTTIGEGAFESCDSLTSVTIPDSVTTIGEDAFCNCGSLTSVTIPDSVTTIGDYAFAGCSLTSGVYCEATTPPSLSGGDVFDYNASGRLIYVPAASVDAYKSAEGWSEYADAIVGYDF